MVYYTVLTVNLILHSPSDCFIQSCTFKNTLQSYSCENLYPPEDKEPLNLMELANYLTIPEVQIAGRVTFLIALALILGSSILAFISEIKQKADSRKSFPVMSHNITGATWIWILILGIFGGATVFTPLLSSLEKINLNLVTALSSAVALLLLLFYHFTANLLKNRYLHAPFAFLAAISALGAAIVWYHPHTCSAWFQSRADLSNQQEIFFWWLGREEIARFLHFVLNAIGLAALFFLLANAAEKEKKRKQTRDYYFQAAAYGGRWLLTIVTLQTLPLSWLFYNQAANNPASIFSPPGVYWFAAIITTALLGWLLLIKIIKDGLVNRRATLIIAIFFIASLSLFHFSPLREINPTANTTKTNQTR